MTAKLFVFPTRQTRPPEPASVQADDIIDVRQHFAQLAAARDTNVSNPYLTMVDGIDRLIAEAGLEHATYLIKSALRVRGLPVEVKPL